MTTHMNRLDGQLVTLFGGGGFVGRHAAQALMQAGARVRIVQRHPMRAAAVRALGNLGQVQLVGADIAEPEQTIRAAQGSDAIVNLVGILKGDFDALHVDGAANIAKAAAHVGAAKMIQLSAIGADSKSPSAYGRSKAMGEQAVHSIYPGAVILRPSIIFGQQDRFINRFAALIRSTPIVPIVPIVAPNTRFQPIFVGDVARAIVAPIGGDAMAGGTFELGGAQIFSMRELLMWIARQIGRDPLFIELPDALAGGLATLTGWLPGAPITRDQWAMLGRDNVVNSRASGLSALGITPTALDSIVPGWLDIYRPHGRFSAPGDRSATA
ncbi:MAG: complex I NDUFA9 subunit family protein [Sphingopyxis sp.]